MVNLVVHVPQTATVEDSSALSLAQRALSIVPSSWKQATPLMLVSQKS